MRRGMGEIATTTSGRPSCRHGLVVLMILLSCLVAGAQSQCSGRPRNLYASTYTKSLRFPSYGTHYGNNQTCMWKISSTVNWIIQLKVVSLDLQSSPSCSRDSLSIYDGASEYYARLARLCGSLHSLVYYYSSRHFMFLKFRSDGNVTGSGFELRYKAMAMTTTTTRPTTRAAEPTTTTSTWPTTFAVSRRTTRWPYTYAPTTSRPITYTPVPYQCSRLRTLTVESGYPVSIFSPNYPSKYPNNQLCGWRVKTSMWNHVVRLYIYDFNVEYDDDCSYDRLSVYDESYADSSHLLKKLCGRLSRSYVYSSGQYMFLQFRSDSSVQMNGFHVQVVAVPVWSVPSSSSTTTTTTTTRRPTTTTTTTTRVRSRCSGTQHLIATSNFKILYSPNYPGDYGNNLDCGWKIQASAWNQIVRLQILEFDLEEQDDCSFDSLSIYDGSGQNSERLHNLCGYNVAGTNVYSSSRYMYIQFKTDNSGTRSGFKLRYSAAQDACSSSQYLNASSHYSSILSSPSYPLHYDNNLDCGWTITANEWGQVIRLHVVDLDLEEHDGCTYDSLSVYDGSGPNGQRLRKFCGRWSNVAFIYSTSRSMYIRFKTDGSNAGKGFKLEYRAVESSGRPTTPSIYEYETYILTAPGFVDSSSMSLKSDGYPSYYQSWTKKMWTIRTQSDYIVKLRVVDMDLQNSADCDENKIAVYDSGYRRLIATMCNYQFVGVDLYSSDRELYIYFTTGRASDGRGFKFLYYSVSHAAASHSYTTRSQWDHPDFADSSNKSGSNAAAVGGTIAGVLILIVLVVMGLFFYCRAKRMSLSAGALPPARSLAFRNPSAVYNNNSSNNNNSSSPGVYVLPRSPSAPQAEGHVNMGYAVTADAPPSYFDLQNNGFTFMPGAQAMPSSTYPAMAPPKYAEAMLMSHPPAEGAIVGIPAQVGNQPLGVSAPPPDPDPPIPETQPGSNPAAVSGGGDHAGGVGPDYFTCVQTTGEEPHVYAALENTSSERLCSNN